MTEQPQPTEDRRRKKRRLAWLFGGGAVLPGGVLACASAGIIAIAVFTGSGARGDRDELDQRIFEALKRAETLAAGEDDEGDPAGSENPSEGAGDGSEKDVDPAVKEAAEDVSVLSDDEKDQLDFGIGEEGQDGNASGQAQFTASPWGFHGGLGYGLMGFGGGGVPLGALGNGLQQMALPLIGPSGENVGALTDGSAGPSPSTTKPGQQFPDVDPAPMDGEVPIPGAALLFPAGAALWSLRKLRSRAARSEA
ncbi:MAG: hypothetical protein AAGG79_01755 [Pseudomonadota bacterium]